MADITTTIAKFEIMATKRLIIRKQIIAFLRENEVKMARTPEMANFVRKIVQGYGGEVSDLNLIKLVRSVLEYKPKKKK